MNQMVGSYFEIGLFMAVVASGIISLIDRLFFQNTRYQAVLNAHPELPSLPKKAQKKLLKAPLLADYARSLFSVFLFVFLFRAFVAELFVVPSGSMLPTIQLGDYMVVNKFAYGLRLPFKGSVLVPVGRIQRGDIVVFKYPVDPQVDFIKRIIGLPGDHITYINKTFYINGEKISHTYVDTITEPNNVNLGNTTVMQYQEKLGNHLYIVDTTPGINRNSFSNLVVPPKHYFAIGDNRDNSEDSRYWGFVPDNAIVGKAEFIVFSWDSLTHSIRFGRMGHFLP